jgi:hypothetical protein
MVTPTNTGVRIEVEVWCDTKTGAVNLVGAEPRLRQLILGVKRGSSPDQLLRTLLAEYGKPHERSITKP